MSLRDILLQIRNKHGRVQPADIERVMQSAAVDYDRGHPRLSMNKFGGTMQYEIYLVNWYRERREFQEERLREVYKLGGGDK